jgi:perosamine synthetase
MAVHLYGFATRVDLLREIADRANVKLVEDVAEAFGATLNGAPLGTFGDVATYSFFCQQANHLRGGGRCLNAGSGIGCQIEVLEKSRDEFLEKILV